VGAAAVGVADASAISTAVGSGTVPQATIHNVVANNATTIHIHRIAFSFMMISSSRLEAPLLAG
jgi:hypothetical protein